MRKTLIALAVGGAFAAGQHVTQLGDGTADVPGIDVELAEAQPHTALSTAPEVAASATGAVDLASAEQLCLTAPAHPPQPDQPATAHACDLLVALVNDEPTRRKALLAAAEQLAPHAADLSDERLRMLAASGDVDALVDLAQTGQMRDPSTELQNRELLMAAAQAGSQRARQELTARRDRLVQGQALTRPEFLVALVEARPQDIPDTVQMRRYAVGYGRALERSCPFDVAAIDTAGFRKAQDQFAATLNTAGHLRLAGAAADAAGTALKATGAFVADMTGGRGYTESGGQFLRQWREAQRTLSAAGSTGSEDGARDAVRSVNLVGGCAQPQGLRLIRGLHALYAARAVASPQP